MDMRYDIRVRNEGRGHQLRYQNNTFTNNTYVKCNIKYILSNAYRTYQALSLWLSWCNINPLSGILWLVFAFFRTLNYVEVGLCMCKIKYERIIVAKSYLCHVKLLYIYMTNHMCEFGVATN